MTKKVKEVKEEVKRIGEGELKQILEVQKSMTEILQQLGIMEAEKHSLVKNLDTLRENQTEIKKALESKYGPININLEDGSYTELPAEEEK